MAWCWSSYSKGNKKKKKKSYPDCSTRLFHNFILLFCFSAFLYFFLSLFFFFLNFVVVAWKSLQKANEKSFWRDLIERIDSMKIEMNSLSGWKTVFCFFEKYPTFFKVLLIRVQFLRTCNTSILENIFSFFLRRFYWKIVSARVYLFKCYTWYKLIVPSFRALHEISDFSWVSLERRNEKTIFQHQSLNLFYINFQ